MRTTRTVKVETTLPPGGVQSAPVALAVTTSGAESSVYTCGTVWTAEYGVGMEGMTVSTDVTQAAVRRRAAAEQVRSAQADVRAAIARATAATDQHRAATADLVDAARRAQAAGLSHRAIAPLAGVSHQRVHALVTAFT